MAGEETSWVENQQDSSAPRHALRSSNNPAPTIAHSTDEGEPGWGGTYQGYSAVDKKPRTSPRSGKERRKHHTMVEKFKVRIEGYGVTQRVSRVNSKEILRETLFTYPLKPGRVHGLNEGQQQGRLMIALLPPKERRWRVIPESSSEERVEEQIERVQPVSFDPSSSRFLLLMDKITRKKPTGGKASFVPLDLLPLLPFSCSRRLLCLELCAALRSEERLYPRQHNSHCSPFPSPFLEFCSRRCRCRCRIHRRHCRRCRRFYHHQHQHQHHHHHYHHYDCFCCRRY